MEEVWILYWKEPGVNGKVVGVFSEPEINVMSISWESKTPDMWIGNFIGDAYYTFERVTVDCILEEKPRQQGANN